MYLFETEAGNQTFCSASVFITPACGSSHAVARFNFRRNNISVIIIHLHPEVLSWHLVGLSIESGMERSGISVLRENAIFDISETSRSILSLYLLGHPKENAFFFSIERDDTRTTKA